MTNQDLRQFAYVASHDLQEPLRNVCIFAEMLARSLHDGELTASRRQYIDIITSGAHRMETLIADLLTYSRLSVTEKLEYAQTDFEPIFEQALKNLGASIGESGATITHGPLPTVDASSSQMSQVLQNLIGNAIKYRRPDVPLHVHVGAEREEGQWLLSVKDNGSGFDPRYAENIFGIFKRLHGSEIPGTGIGLAVCKTVVERHGGRIWAEAKPLEGATFYFTIPDRN
jgi:chemotaxis family two-component system sensor kinase Cph1